MPDIQFLNAITRPILAVGYYSCAGETAFPEIPGVRAASHVWLRADDVRLCSRVYVWRTATTEQHASDAVPR